MINEFKKIERFLSSLEFIYLLSNNYIEFLKSSSEEGIIYLYVHLPPDAKIGLYGMLDYNNISFEQFQKDLYLMIISAQDYIKILHNGIEIYLLQPTNSVTYSSNVEEIWED